jgi:transcriptional regulator with XRE-family HTH domain
MELKKIERATDITVFQLRSARYGLKLSLKTVSELTGISEPTLYSLESGDIYFPPEKSRLLTILKVRNVYRKYGVDFFEDNIIKLLTGFEGVEFRFVSKKSNNNS